LFSCGDDGEKGTTHGEGRSKFKRKKSNSPPTYESWNTSPPTYENGFFYPSELSKTEQITPEAVWKNHSKSQKNHKMENPIVLDSK
jgi:hypothetical protein